MNYNAITDIELETTCRDCNYDQWEKLMEGAVRANKKEINRLVKQFLPNIYESLALNLRNPYNYYRTDNHLILVHSAIEYFFRFER